MLIEKALYGLKQASRAWYGWIDGFLMKLGFIKSDADSNLYYKVVEGDTLILVLYVDDLFHPEMIELFLGARNSYRQSSR